MKPSPLPNPHSNRARAVLRPSPRPGAAAHDALDRPDVAPARPGGGVATHRHGQGAARTRPS